MTGTRFDYRLARRDAPALGLIVLRSDETIEADFRRLLPPSSEWLTTRVPAAPEVTAKTLAQMEDHLTAAAELFPLGMRFAAIGYGCTSGTAQIGASRVSELIRSGAETGAVTEPVSALIAACREMRIVRLAVLSPYVAEVSARLCGVLADQGIDTPVFGSFDVAEEAAVARIDGASILVAAETLMNGAEVDGLFLSCTNLRTLDVVAELEHRLAKPVLTSNLVLAWHMMKLGGLAPVPGVPGRLFVEGFRPESF